MGVERADKIPKIPPGENNELEEMVIREGIILKQSRGTLGLGRLKRRRLVLTNVALRWARSGQPGQIFDLANLIARSGSALRSITNVRCWDRRRSASVPNESPPPAGARFEVTTSDGISRVWIAPSPETAVEWVEAIRAAIAEAPEWPPGGLALGLCGGGRGSSSGPTGSSASSISSVSRSRSPSPPRSLVGGGRGGGGGIGIGSGGGGGSGSVRPPRGAGESSGGRRSWAGTADDNSARFEAGAAALLGRSGSSLASGKSRANSVGPLTPSQLSPSTIGSMTGSPPRREEGAAAVPPPVAVVVAVAVAGDALPSGASPQLVVARGAKACASVPLPALAAGHAILLRFSDGGEAEISAAALPRSGQDGSVTAPIRGDGAALAASAATVTARLKWVPSNAACSGIGAKRRCGGGGTSFAGMVSLGSVLIWTAVAAAGLAAAAAALAPAIDFCWSDGSSDGDSGNCGIAGSGSGTAEEVSDGNFWSAVASQDKLAATAAAAGMLAALLALRRTVGRRKPAACKTAAAAGLTGTWTLSLVQPVVTAAAAASLAAPASPQLAGPASPNSPLRERPRSLTSSPRHGRPNSLGGRPSSGRGFSFRSPAGFEATAPAVPRRFLEGCPGDPGEARRRYELTLAWRAEEGVDSILLEKQPHFDVIKMYYPHFFCGKALSGNHVYYERPGQVDMEALRGAGVTIDMMLRYYLFLTEWCWRVLDPREDEGKLVSVFDASGISLRDAWGDCLEFTKRASAVHGQHYIERCQLMLLVNVPMWFSAIWKVVKPLVNERTLAKIKILRSGEVLAEMRKHLDDSQIPEIYGGSLAFPGFGPEADTCRFYSDEMRALTAFVANINSGGTHNFGPSGAKT